MTAIEPDPERYRYGDESLDVRLIRGEAMDIGCWREADAGTMACVICVTDNDAVNMMSAQIAEKFGIPYKIVRVHSLQFGLPGSLLSGADLKVDLLINPEEMVAQEITRLVKLRHGNEVIDVADQKIQLLAARITHDSQFADQKLKDISLKHSKFAFRVVAVARGITTIIPDGEFEIMPHDQIVVMTDSVHLPEMMEIAGVPQGVRQRVLIVGGQGPGGYLTSAVVWDAASDTPVRAGSLGGARADHTATPLPDGRVLIVGGGIAIGEGLESLRDRGRPMMALYVGGMGAKTFNVHKDHISRFGFADAANDSGFTAS